MPYGPEHKRRSRDKIVAAARSLFNRRGFVDVSIDEVMAEAGLTRGGFYNHFANKDALLVAAIEAYGECNPADRWDGVELDDSGLPADIARQFLAAYLSSEHLDDVTGHCPLVALPAEVAHGGAALRRSYKVLLDRMIGVFADACRDDEAALALTAQCVGAMLIARTVDEPELAQRVLLASRRLARRELERCSPGERSA